jgi:hypothetical protein
MDQRVVRPAAILAGAAVAPLVVVNHAFARTELALDLSVGLLFVELRLADELRVAFRGQEWNNAPRPNQRAGACRKTGQGNALQKRPAVLSSLRAGADWRYNVVVWGKVMVQGALRTSS